MDNKSGRLYLLDLGASWATGAYTKQAEKLEVRAFGVLINELLELQQDATTEQGRKLRETLSQLSKSCLDVSTSTRPSFSEIGRVLENLLDNE